MGKSLRLTVEEAKKMGLISIEEKPKEGELTPDQMADWVQRSYRTGYQHGFDKQKKSIHLIFAVCFIGGWLVGFVCALLMTRWWVP